MLLRLVALLQALQLFATALAAVPMTVVIPANERKCYYVYAHSPDAKVRAAFTVMQGGAFDIDATLVRPDHTVLERKTKSEGDEFVFTAQVIGEFELCFYNEMSTLTDKKIEFEFEIDTNAVTARLPPAVGEENADKIEKYIATLEERAAEISRKLLHYKTRNARNESTVESTGSRVRWFSFIELVVIIGMAILNVNIVQFFFKGSRRTLV